MSKCPKCGAPADGSQDVCGVCGQSLEGTTQSFAPVGAEESESPLDVSLAEGPVLVVRKGPELGERFYIDRPRLSIGRDPGADVFLNDVTVSRSHAVVTSVGDEVSIEDAGSLNGLYVNGVCVDKAILKDGDGVQVGMFKMVYLSGKGE